jgi:hypothetical protein
LRQQIRLLLVIHAPRHSRSLGHGDLADCLDCRLLGYGKRPHLLVRQLAAQLGDHNDFFNSRLLALLQKD